MPPPHDPVEVLIDRLNVQREELNDVKERLTVIENWYHEVIGAGKLGYALWAVLLVVGAAIYHVLVTLWDSIKR